jgi:hypothetical protein
LKKINVTSFLLPKTLATKRKIERKERKQREREERKIIHSLKTNPPKKKKN